METTAEDIGFKKPRNVLVLGIAPDQELERLLNLVRKQGVSVTHITDRDEWGNYISTPGLGAFDTVAVRSAKNLLDQDLQPVLQEISDLPDVDVQVLGVTTNKSALFGAFGYPTCRGSYLDQVLLFLRRPSLSTSSS